ncbi:MAG: acetylxylan esterase [Bryobacteraceae bacterium]|nr:acetylxylan esterase [Bryobacteraceae bacterium]
MIGLLFASLLAAQDGDPRLTPVEGTNHVYQMPKYGSLAEWKQRREHLRKQILAAAGLLPMPAHGPVRSEIFGKLEREGYSIEKVWIETMPGYYLGGNLYRPLGRTGPFPGIVSPHGHWKRGRIEDGEHGSIPARCINLARQGYVVLAYDMVGYNDTKQTPHAFGGKREDLYNFGPLGLQLWNSIRAVDFIEALPDVDKDRIGATGASGGGTQTFLLTAVDDRIKVSVPVNMISGIMQGGSPCENACGLRHGTNNVDIGAMMAPRPMLMVAATGDWTKNVPKNEYPAIKAIYELYDMAARVEAVQFDAPHNYNKDSREAMYTFFARHFLASDGSKVSELPYTVEKDEDMLVWAGREMPPGSLDAAGVFEQWKKLTRVETPDAELLRYALSVEAPAGSDRVPGVYHEGKGTPVLIVGKARRIPKGRPVLEASVWMTGTAAGVRDTSARHFYTFHRTDDQYRVQDILTAINWLRAKHPGRIEIRAAKGSSLWALFAAAVDGGDLRLRLNLKGMRGGDDEFEQQFYVPGIQRVGGLAAAMALTREMR